MFSAAFDFPEPNSFTSLSTSSGASLIRLPPILTTTLVNYLSLKLSSEAPVFEGEASCLIPLASANESSSSLRRSGGEKAIFFDIYSGVNISIMYGFTFGTLPFSIF